MAHTIQYIVGFMLPPVEALAAHPELAIGTLTAAVAARHAFPEAYKTLENGRTERTKAAITAWLAQCKAAFITVKNTHDATLANTLFVITTPEFCFNGYLGRQNEKIYNARNPLPDSMETWIEAQVRIWLEEFSALHVLFSFSFTGYQAEFVEEKGNIIVRGYSRINVISSVAGAAVKQIRKQKPVDTDGWVAPFAQEAFTVTAENRLTEVQLRLANCWPGIVDREDKPPVLAFVTCGDGEIQDNGTVNLVVLLGAGSPLQNIKDTTHAFLLNDCDCWLPYYEGPSDTWLPTTKQLLREAGFYEFVSDWKAGEAVGGANLASVGTRISQRYTPEQKKLMSKAMYTCFHLNEWVTDENPRGPGLRYKFTRAVEMPELTVQGGRSKKFCIIL